LRPQVYLETTVISYLTAAPSRDIVQAAHQQITREWWERRKDFDLFVSQAVITEAGRGDSGAAARRLAALEDVGVLEVTEDASGLVEAFIEQHALPARAAVDALHIAVAVVMGMDHVLAWQKLRNRSAHQYQLLRGNPNQLRELLPRVRSVLSPGFSCDRLSRFVHRLLVARMANSGLLGEVGGAA
jgi:hypothetical protein